MIVRTYRPISVLLLLGFLLLGVGVWIDKMSIGHFISGQPWVLPSRVDLSGSRLVSPVEMFIYAALGLAFTVAGVYTFFVWIANSVTLLEDRVVVRSMGKVSLSSPYAKMESIIVEKTAEYTAALIICAENQKAQIGPLYANRKQVADELRSRSPHLQ